MLAGPIRAADKPTRAHLTPDACAQCHGVGESGPPARFGPANLPRLVRLDEFTTWNERDKHRRAFDALTGPRGREIGAAMGYADVAREKACLTCHGTGFLPADPSPLTSGAMESRTQGVGCTACHGPYLEWVQNHGLAGEPIRRWRQLSPAEKSRDFGMADLRDPATRASVCLSCHLGNAAEGKTVTHAMYAAGHPPLPGVEVEAFGQAMPPHWWSPDEVPAYRQDPELRARHGVVASESARSRAAMVGGVVAFRDSMRLLSAEARRSGSSWPEYARFECYSCHHDLESPGYRGWRQARGYGLRFDGLVLKGKSGHAQIRPSPLALVEPALGLAEDSIGVREPFRDGLKALQATINDRPFGDPIALAGAADRLEAASRTLLESLDASRFDRSTPPRILESLTALGEREILDYDSARQVAWAIRTVHAEWLPGPINDDQIVATIDELDHLLKLDPYASRPDRAKLVAQGNPDRDGLGEGLLRLSEAEYKTSLAAAAEYHPARFQALMARLSALIAVSRPRALPPTVRPSGDRSAIGGRR